jgi:hypothetical protein
MSSVYVWLSLALVGLGYEFFTLRSHDDLHNPLTWHLRRLFQRSWIRVLGIGFWIWLPLHLAGVVP